MKSPYSPKVFQSLGMCPPVKREVINSVSHLPLIYIPGEILFFNDNEVSLKVYSEIKR